MRILAVILVAVVIAAALVAVIFVTDEGQPDLSAADNIDKDRVEALELNLARAQQEIEVLKAAIQELSAEAATSAERTGPAAASPGKAAPAAPEAVVEASPAGGEKKHIMVPPPEGDIRQVIREEMEKVEDERRKEMEERRKSFIAEQWEIDEFKELASTIHSTGVILDLTDKQKRLYHPILKEYGERIRSLWKEVQDGNPGTEMGELHKRYKEESDRLLKTTREQVEDILTPEQRKKYRKECKKNHWFK